MSIVLIFDCGATNLRTIAMNDKGKIMASHHLANNTQQGSESPDYHIWDFEEIWQKLTMCADNTITQLKQQQVDLKEIVGISVTTLPDYFVEMPAHSAGDGKPPSVARHKSPLSTQRHWSIQFQHFI